MSSRCDHPHYNILKVGGQVGAAERRVGKGFWNGFIGGFGVDVLEKHSGGHQS